MVSNIVLRLMPIILILTGNLFGQYSIQHSVIGGGGGSISGGSYSLSGTIGQPLAGTSGNGSNTVSVGFWYAVQSSIVTSVENTGNGIPQEFRLDQNYPNPFNPSTTIRFSLPQSDHVSLTVYDLMGRKIATLIDERMEPGEYSTVFDAAGIASGMYIYRITAGARVTTRRMILLK
jgi:hypothetical protein